MKLHLHLATVSKQTFTFLSGDHSGSIALYVNHVSISSNVYVVTPDTVRPLNQLNIQETNMMIYWKPVQYETHSNT
jgi:hypothetical protein